MDETPEDAARPSPDLKAALRRARLENAERSEAISELRRVEAARLELVEGAIRPVIAQTPPGVDLFDLGIAPGERPRLFLDMIGFIEMARDRRTYRFYQDTRHGRVLIAESAKVEPIVAAVTNYVARRLVERERALAADWEALRDDEARRTARRPAAAQARPATRPRRTKLEVVGDALSFLLMTLGAVALVLILAAGAYFAWALWLRDLFAGFPARG